MSAASRTELDADLDALAQTTSVLATSRGVNPDGASSYDVSWNAQDDASGVKHVTV